MGSEMCIRDRTVKKNTVKEGFTIENEIKNVDGSVELVVTRWT